MGHIFRTFCKFSGPGYMVAIGYMDPGNWATDIEAGSRFGYELLFVILLSAAMATILQHLCVRLGVTARLDLAQACRRRMPRWANIPMYIIAEVAIISCDLAEVIGTAIALKLLLGIPIMYGVLLTILDVLLLLAGLNFDAPRRPLKYTTGDRAAPPSSGEERAGGGRAYRVLEGLVIFLMTVIGICFAIELFIVQPQWGKVAYGFLPFQAASLILDKRALASALGIIGATVMPHNLYLHSSIVQHRLEDLDDTIPEAQDEPLSLPASLLASPTTSLVASLASDPEAALVIPYLSVASPLPHLAPDGMPCSSQQGGAVTWRKPSLTSIIRYATADSTVALFFAMLVNSAILITASAAFHARGEYNVRTIEDACKLMRSWLGGASALIFGLALLAAGQSSTVTGTIAGQIVFEGHLHLPIRPWARRLLTRSVAIIPALVIVVFSGEGSINDLLIYSQVILSFQLPFAIIPLIVFAFYPDPRDVEASSVAVPPSSPLGRQRVDERFAQYWLLRRERRTSEAILFVLSCAIAIILIMLNVLFIGTVVFSGA